MLGNGQIVPYREKLDTYCGDFKIDVCPYLRYNIDVATSIIRIWVVLVVATLGIKLF